MERGLILNAILYRPVPLWATVALSLWIVVACLFCVSYVSSEHPKYFHDWGGYYDHFRHYGAYFADGRFGSLLYLTARSIFLHDYNNTSIMPLLPMFAFFGGARAIYIISLVMFYLLPVSALAAITASVTRQTESPSWNAGPIGIALPSFPPAWLLLTASLYWPFWGAAMRGLPDIVGLGPLGLASLIVLYANRFRRRPVATGIVLGVLIWSAFLLRRWYAYSCVSLLLLSAACWLWAAVREPKSRNENLWALAVGLAACGVVIAVAPAVFQHQVVMRILTVSYKDAYFAFQLPYEDHLSILYGFAGPIILCGTLAGVVRGLSCGRWRVVFLVACAIVSQLMLSRTQAPGIQHILPFFFWVFPAFAYGVSWPFDLMGRPWTRLIWVVPAIMLLSFGSVFSPAARERLSTIEPLLPSRTVFPLRIENFPTYLKLIEDLKTLLGPESRFAVFASNEHLNGSLLAAIDHSLSERYETVSQIDARDGFEFQPLTAEFAVVTDRPALTYQADLQQVVSIPNNMIVSGDGLGSGYRRVLGPYIIGGGYSAYVYQRSRPLSEADKREIIEGVHERYSNWVVTPEGLSPR